MHTTSPRSASPRVLIDCARWSTDALVGTSGDNVLQWVRTSPADSVLHVVLAGIVSGQATRKLRSHLLSLGCTVTAKC